MSCLNMREQIIDALKSTSEGAIHQLDVIAEHEERLAVLEKHFTNH